MQTFKSLPDAIALAEFAHRNQLDKAGLPYIEHPKRVLAKVQAQGALPYVQIAAILHDVTEDTRFTSQMLIDLGFSEAAVDVITLLDRDRNKEHGYSDDEYYIRISKNPGAVLVKEADMEDNLSPWRLAYLPAATRHRLRRKYEYGRLMVNGFTASYIEAHMRNWDLVNPDV